MIVILGIDGLEYEYVKKFECNNLMQRYYGKTDLSDFEQPRTMVIWSSFLAGKNLEKEILSMENFWEFRLKPEETFFKHFNSYKAIDVPGFNQDMDQHKKERKAMKDFFDGKISIEDYDALVLNHHKKVKEAFFEALEGDYEIVMGYFNAADVIGHLSFGILPKMRVIYKEMDEIAGKVLKKKVGPMLVISDHGMKAIGRYGDHSEYGFWSLPTKIDKEFPKPTEFYNILTNLRGQ